MNSYLDLHEAVCLEVCLDLCQAQDLDLHQRAQNLDLHQRAQSSDLHQRAQSLDLQMIQCK